MTDGGGDEMEMGEVNEGNGLNNAGGTRDMRGSNMDDAAPTPARSESTEATSPWRCASV